MEPCFGGKRHTLLSLVPAMSSGLAQKRKQFPSTGLSWCWGQLRPCTEAGGEWLCATVTSSPWGGGSGLESALASSVILENTLRTDHLFDSLMLPQTLGFRGQGFVAHYP